MKEHQALDFNILVEHLRTQVQSAVGAEALSASLNVGDYENAKVSQSQAEDRQLDTLHLVALNIDPSALPFSSLGDLQVCQDRLRHFKTLNGPELSEILNALHAGTRIFDCWDAHGTHKSSEGKQTWQPNANRAAASLSGKPLFLECLHVARERCRDHEQAFEALLESLDDALDGQGSFRDDASEDLLRLTGDRRRLENRLLKSLQEEIQTLEPLGVLNSNVPTLRRGRHVLCVRAGFQNRVVGIVHDASQSEQSVFIEPENYVKQGNRLVLLNDEIQAEEARLAKLLSDKLAAAMPTLNRVWQALGLFEAYLLRAQYVRESSSKAYHFNATQFEVESFRSPALELSESESANGVKSPLVPLSLSLQLGEAWMLSGPNAGGKSVALKAMGLAILMSRAGLPLPTSRSATLPFVDDLQVLLGDGQDVSAGESSFSAQLNQIRPWLEPTDGKHVRVFLVDELGASTDPDEGSSLAQALFEELSGPQNLVLATTHFQSLKAMGIARKGAFRSGAMAVDESGRPTYQFRSDDLGQSKPLELARRLNFPETLLKRAREIKGGDDKTDALWEELNRLHQKVEAREAQAEQALSDAKAKEAELNNAREALRQNEENIEARVRESLSSEIAEVRALVGDAVRKQQRGLTSQETTELNHSVAEIAARITPDHFTKTSADKKGGKQDGTRAANSAHREAASKIKTNDEEGYHLGDRVRVSGFEGTIFDVIEVTKKGVVVAKGPLRVTPKLEALTLVESKAQKDRNKARRTSQSTKTKSLKKQKSEPRNRNNTLDLRGHRVANAESTLTDFVAKMLERGHRDAYILHGHGTGAMKAFVREWVRSSPLVGKSESAHHDDGGDAVTHVFL